jgi:hypothetical protein
MTRMKNHAHFIGNILTFQENCFIMHIFFLLISEWFKYERFRGFFLLFVGELSGSFFLFFYVIIYDIGFN